MADVDKCVLQREKMLSFPTYLSDDKKNTRRIFKQKIYACLLETLKRQCLSELLWHEGVYQFTEHYITNANTVPMLILFFLYDFKGTQQRLCAACCWLVNVPALPANHCQLNIKASLNMQHTLHARLQCFP